MVVCKKYLLVTVEKILCSRLLVVGTAIDFFNSYHLWILCSRSQTYFVSMSPSGLSNIFLCLILASFVRPFVGHEALSYNREINFHPVCNICGIRCILRVAVGYHLCRVNLSANQGIKILYYAQNSELVAWVPVVVWVYNTCRT